VGFKLDYHFAPAEAIANSLTPILDKLIVGDTLHFGINQNFDPMTFSFTTNDGLQYSIDSAKVSITFSHRLRAKLLSGKVPTMEMLSVAKPYTKLLAEVSDKLIDATCLLPGFDTRKLRRIGIITSTSAAEEDLPPGILDLLHYLGRPWRQTDLFNVQVAGQIEDTGEWTDRCIHHIIKPEGDPEQLLTLSFDWQRSFKSGKEMTRHSLSELLAGAQKAALAYFEQIGEGSRFDEEIIRNSTRT
jgi:hypothetical protein